MDSLFNEVKTAIKANFMQKTILETSIITLDNIGVNLVDTMVEFSDGLHLDIASADLEFAVIGNAKDSSGVSQGMFGLNVNAPDPSLLDHVHSYVRDAYFVKSRPQYQDLDVGSVISVKDHGAVGDGAHDDTSAIVAALALATTSNLIYFPAGSYIVTSTIVIPPHVRMTGEVWSQLVASGSYFGNMASPKPMIKVGNAGDVGTVEISDILFTSIGALPGLIMVEWNVQAETPGSVGMWDAHFRVGGAYGSKLQVSQCPKSAPIQTGCIAAAMMMHVTPSSNGYFENVWAWVADHDIDDVTNTQVGLFSY
jgi:glucan 1,3-beta-glucosidase